MEIEGKIIVINDTQTFGTKGFQKREFVVEVPDEKYPQKIPLEFTKDKCDILDGFSVGQTVKVQFNLRGSEYNGRWFLNAQAWRIEGGASGAAKPAPASAKPAASRPTSKPASAVKPAPANEDAPW